MRRPCCLVAALTAVLVALAAPAGAVGAHRTAGAGSAGIGDGYYGRDGNGGYQVVHYDIHDTYRFDSGRLTGWTDLTARATQDLSRFNLDLVLAAVEVWVDGTPARFAKDGRHELVVTPASPIPRGREFTVRVRYRGVPGRIAYRGTYPWFSTDREVMATNQPHIAPWWFPANDHPRDKAAFDISLTVPRGKQAISNGELVERSTSGEWSTWHWRMREPMAPYLAFFAAGRFRWEQGTARGLRYLNAVSRGLGAAQERRALRLMRRSPGIVRWLETQLGDYPFASVGGVTTSLFTGFALENQGRPTYPYLGNDRYARDTVVHELAHQWFGDSVTVGRWRDIWLNEGFATWFEWRYAESHGGVSAHRTLMRHYRARPRDDAFWRVLIGDPGPQRLFDAAVYERGAMAVQALRNRIGERDFRRLLRRWVALRADRHGRVPQLERLAEQVSGEQLDGFFRAWLFRGTRPRPTAANGLR